MRVRIRPRLVFRFGTATLLCTAAWGAPPAAEPRAYDITATTAMPHLEENLRYATTRERRCLDPHDASSVFPILQHPSLYGCKLFNLSLHDGTTRHFSLVCAQTETATGAARLEDSPGRITGVLEVKMGGKNMTFAQRVEAVPRGACPPPEPLQRR